MKQNTALPAYAESIQYDLKELLVAYDFSAAADSSLKYAVMLSKRFGSFIHLIGSSEPSRIRQRSRGRTARDENVSA